MNSHKNVKKNPNKRQPRHRFLKWVFKFLLVAIVITTPYIIYLDSIVQEKFSGKRWTIPAKVYARPLELFKGQKLSKEDFLTELNALGYKPTTTPNSTGQFNTENNTVDVYIRGFKFYEGEETPKPIHVSFSGNNVDKLTGQDNKIIELVRLEPMIIGGVYPAHNEDRILIKLDQLPPYLKEALIAVEDRNFYKHHGISIKGIIRALLVNITSGRVRQGASTLTQQLVKNFFLTNERSIKRKANEAIMAVLLELHYSKDEILEAYLNEVFLGQDGNRSIHGFGLASQYFFGQPINELNLQQVALLVGMVQGPSAFNPRRNPENALTRRNLVLDILADRKVITPEQAETAKNTPLGVTPQGSLGNNSFPAFVDLVKRQLSEDYDKEDLTGEGLQIFTSLDPILQMKAEKALAISLKNLGKRADNLEAAMVITNPTTGELLGLIGSKDRNFVGFNRALDAIRSIGSQVKPAVYLTALEQPNNYTLTTLLSDEPFTVQQPGSKPWTPQNYDRKSHGDLFLYQGLVHSYNIITARLGLQVGITNVLKTINRLGVQREFSPYPAVLLGAASMTPMDVASMFQTIASGGFNTPIRSIRNVLNSQGQPLKRYPFEVHQQFDAGAIYLLQYAMQRVMREGTGRSAYNQLPTNINLAGKTGTTNDLRDSWFTGFGQDLLATVWLGRDDNGKTSLTGATGPLQIWTNFMKQANPATLNMPTPPNIIYVWVDADTGSGSGEGCPNAVQMPYIKGSQPAPGLPCVTPNGSTDWTHGWNN